jgi:hypothetical protein
MQQYGPLVENFGELLKQPLGFPVTAVVHKDKAGSRRMVDETDKTVAGFNRSVPYRNDYVY